MINKRGWYRLLLVLVLVASAALTVFFFLRTGGTSDTTWNEIVGLTCGACGMLISTILLNEER